MSKMFFTNSIVNASVYHRFIYYEIYFKLMRAILVLLLQQQQDNKSSGPLEKIGETITGVFK